MSFCVDGAWTRQSVSIGGSEPFETQHVYWLQAGLWYADLRVPFHPAGGTSCFAGRSGWDGDRYRWTHDLDLADRADLDHGRPVPQAAPADGPGRGLAALADGPGSGLGALADGPGSGLAAPADGPGSGLGEDDIADLGWDGDRLIECGFLGDLPYEEVWVRLPLGKGDEGESEAQLAPDACFVRVGGHSITIVDARSEGGEFGACVRVRGEDGWQISALIGPMSVGALDYPRVRAGNPAHLAEQDQVEHHLAEQAR